MALALLCAWLGLACSGIARCLARRRSGRLVLGWLGASLGVARFEVARSDALLGSSWRFACCGEAWLGATVCVAWLGTALG